MYNTNKMRYTMGENKNTNSKTEQEPLLGQTSRRRIYVDEDLIEDIPNERDVCCSRTSRRRIYPDETDEDSTTNENNGKDGGWGWVVVAASFFCIAVLDGTCYTAGLLITPLMASLDSDRGPVTLAGSLLTGVYCMCGLGVARLVMRFGTRTVCISGALISYIGLTAASYADHLPELMLGYSVITGIGFGMMYIPAVVAATPYFSKRLSLATSICLCGSGAGTFVLAPLSQYLLDNYGWWWTFRAQSGLALLCAFCGAVMVPVNKEKEIERKKEEEHLKELQERRKSVHLIENGDDSMVKMEKRLQFIMRGRNLHTIYEYCTCSDNLDEQHKLEAHQPKSVDNYNNLEEFNEEDNKISAKLEKSRLRTYTDSSEDSNDLPEVDRIAVILEDDGTNDVNLQTQNAYGNNILAFFLGAEMTNSPYFSTYVLAVAADCLAFFAVYVTYAHLPNFAISVGTAHDNAAFLLSICGIGNSVGRIMGGWLSDEPWIHPRNLKLGSIIVSILPLFFFIGCHSYKSFLFFSLVFGFSSGFLTSVTVSQLIRLLGLPLLTPSFGLISAFRGLSAMVGPPIAAALIDYIEDPGVALLLAGLVMVGAAIINFAANLHNKIVDLRSQYISFN